MFFLNPENPQLPRHFHVFNRALDRTNMAAPFTYDSAVNVASITFSSIMH